MENRAVGKVLGKALSRDQGSVPYPCPDDNTLAAYLDGRLSPGEKLTFEEHTSRCESCRQVLGLALDFAAAESAGKPAAKHVRRPALWWLRSPIAATAAAALVVVLGAVLFTVAPGPPVRTPAPQVSGLRAPEKESKAPASVPVVPPPQEAAAQRPPAPQAPPPPVARVPERDATGAAQRTRIQSDTAAVPNVSDTGLRATTVGGVAGRTDGQPAPEAKAEAAGAMPQLAAEDRARPAAVAPLNKPVSAGREESRVAQRMALSEGGPTPAQAMQMLTERGAAAFETRNLDGLFFSRVGNYWIDGRCAGQPDSAIVETSPNAAEVQDVMAAMPRLQELMQGGRRVIVQHAGKVYVLPPKNRDR